jgi:uncharacterized protein
MRVVLDTNILVSALLIQTGNPPAIYRAWQEGHFTLLTCAEQLNELRATLRKPTIAERIRPCQAGGLANAMKNLPRAWTRSHRRFLLALSEAGKADYLVTGDKSGLLALEHHKARGSCRRAQSPGCSHEPRPAVLSMSTKIILTRDRQRK